MQPDLVNHAVLRVCTPHTCANDLDHGVSGRTARLFPGTWNDDSYGDLPDPGAGGQRDYQCGGRQRPFKVGLDTAKVYGKDGYAQAFGAAGGTIGTGSGAFAALLFVLVLFLLYRPTAKRRIAKDRSGSVDSYRQISRIFFFTVIPVIVSSGVYNINSVIDNGIMAHGMESLGRGKEFLALWGIYNNKYMLLVHVPLAMANSLSSSPDSFAVRCNSA